MSEDQVPYGKPERKTWTAMLPAAIPWQKFNPDPSVLGSIREGEWCLWTMVISGDRNYFSGSWFMRDGQPWINWQGGPSYPANDTVYWARVIKLDTNRRGA